MKKIYKSLIVLSCLSMTFATTSCIDETEPNNVATKKQLASSATAVQALVAAMPAMANNFNSMERASGDERHYDYGYSSMMHIRDVMTGDMPIAESNYDQYSYWEQNMYLGKDYVFSRAMWYFYTKFVQSANNVLAAVDKETTEDPIKLYRGEAYAYRALAYLDMARMYEFLPNDGTKSVNASGNNVLNLTVPIVTEDATEFTTRNNPRVSRDSMASFIKSDLDKATKDLTDEVQGDKWQPTLGCVYGLYARLYMWLENYEQAALYARKAIALGKNTPMTRTESLDPSTGFNTVVSSWMWAEKVQKENQAVQTGIANWTSFMSPEATYGYAGAGVTPEIDATLYSKIKNTDYRKLWFIPTNDSLMNEMKFALNPTTEKSAYKTLVNTPCAGVKFRPGNGDCENNQVGSATAYPVMRIEEMYFIEAEAKAHLDATAGKNLLETFMKTYRDPSYTCSASSMEDVVKEIILQKRIEFWGEGISFFDYKRLNMPVTRSYTGGNWQTNVKFNTTTRPAWMNICFPLNEENNNTAIKGFDNPDPSGCYKLAQ